LKGFSTLDMVVVAGYLIAIATLGSSFYRRKTTSAEYFLGGRSMSWLPVGISIIAADLSAVTVMGTPAWNYAHNWELATMAFGYPLVAPLIVYIFVPFYSRLNLYTAYEYLERRFDLKVRVVTSILFLILRGMHVAVVIYAPSLVINLVTGLPVFQCILFMGCFTTFYTALGGMKAVIWTDVIQFVTVMLGVLLIFVTALGAVHVGIAAAYRTALEAGRLRMVNFSTDPRELTSIWAVLVGGVVLTMGPLATDQAILQRLFTTKSTRDCTQSVILQAILVVPITALLSAAGTVLFVFYHYNPSRLAGLNSPDAIMPFFAIRELPSGISGLIIASIFAASMAVMSAGINALTTATTVDFYQRLVRPNESGEHYARVGRIGTVLWGAAVTVLALLAPYLGELALGYSKVSSFISGPMLGIFLLAVLTRRTTATGALAGAIGGMIVLCAVEFGTDWSFFYQAGIGVAVTVVLGYAASQLMAPPDESKLRGLTIYDRPAARP
jgi:SSS family transporter